MKPNESGEQSAVSETIEGKEVKRLADFDTVVSAALTAAIVDEKQLGEKILAIDALFTGDDAQDATLRERIKTHVLTMLRQHPDLFEKMNFKASLRSPNQGPFFQAVAQALGEIPDLPAKELRYVIEVSRRGKKYDQMEKFFAMQADKLKGDEGIDAEDLRSKATYELHMAAYQQGDDLLKAGKPDEAQVLFLKSKELAEKSIEHALRARDAAGALFGKMNINGLLLPHIGTPMESMALCADVCDGAEKEIARLEKEKERMQRVAMNTCFHRVNILVSEKGDHDAVRALLYKIWENPIYNECRQHPEVAKQIDDALEYCEGQE